MARGGKCFFVAWTKIFFTSATSWSTSGNSVLGHFIQWTDYPKDTLSKRQIIHGTDYPGTDYPKDTLSKRQIIQRHFIQWDTLSNWTLYPMVNFIQCGMLFSETQYPIGHLIQWETLSNVIFYPMGHFMGHFIIKNLLTFASN